ncbi:MAG: HlyD family efflux transporter periplasmic adaptor subunit [Gammaproteobacteria bacterium]|nr:MAG: HlyD family efflux transporter periplasmic adaptor subunit [Gammaproteobacteria bacterium]
MKFMHWLIVLPILAVCACTGDSADADRGAASEPAAEHAEELTSTRIDAAMAREAGIETATAGSAVIRETLVLHGAIVPDPQRVFQLRARFPGVVKEVRKRIGETVRAGEVLAVIEANESLRRYNIVAPAAGVVVSREVNPGAAVENETLLTVVDLSSVWVELAAFQHDMDRILAGQSVTVRDVDGHQSAAGRIENIAPVGSAASQSMTARVALPNPDGLWRPGLFVTGEVTVAETEAPLAVSRTAVQDFHGGIAVFELVGEKYVARPVTLGRMDADRVEVLSGIEAGALYVSAGSYLIKSDLDKSGVEHND